MSLFIMFPTRLAPSELPSLFIVFPTRLPASDLLKRRYLSCSPPDWRPRSYQSVAIYGVSYPTDALGITKVSLFIVFPTRLAPLELTECRYLSK